MDPIRAFRKERDEAILEMGRDGAFRDLSLQWILKSNEHKYGYDFTWLGRPIIQFPNDMFILQELIWSVRPDLIIETGIAHGGSIIFSASMLELLGGEGRVVGIDIDIREHNRKEIENHPMMKRIVMLEGSSIDPAIVRASPGKTGRLHFTRKRRRLAGPSQSVVQAHMAPAGSMPTPSGAGKPAAAATSASWWMGFRSPLAPW